MATAEDIRLELARTKDQLRESVELSQRLEMEVQAANERQQLRREVDKVKAELQEQSTRNSFKRTKILAIDQDARGPYPPEGVVVGRRRSLHQGTRIRGHCSDQQELDCSQAVSTGTFTWKISGMSWLKEALEQNNDAFAWSSDFLRVGYSQFDFIYNPYLDEEVEVENEDAECVRVSFGIRQASAGGIVFRYKVYVQRNDGEFIQWGQHGKVCLPHEDCDSRIWGPDVVPAADVDQAEGIFGLSHEELLASEWVKNDAMTLRVELEVRDRIESSLSDLRRQDAVKIPPPTILSNLLAFFETEMHADVIFNVGGEVIKAHSQVLAARSEVFERQLFGSLREARSKEVSIEDTHPQAFKALLKFLYTDDLDEVATIIREYQKSSGSTTAAGMPVTTFTRTALLQEVLAASHKYQLPRLTCWCEQELCEHVHPSQVCSLLCQAHLCEAKHLEEVCLKCIKDNMDKIVASQEFARLTADWPQVLLKISLFAAGVRSKDVDTAVTMQQSLKRKREG
eukprot:TRINITY_DN79835_c0_g1_i1.p1 TRINITY_DN79835_c0_g1~~TRINITY_DN79835_c0_g1_i1.p1  ORF type:complete len:525 (+),score=87.31 TRINITY_DN79835_c0_g1_i1:42-1577(+)